MISRNSKQTSHFKDHDYTNIINNSYTYFCICMMKLTPFACGKTHSYGSDPVQWSIVIFDPEVPESVAQRSKILLRGFSWWRMKFRAKIFHRRHWPAAQCGEKVSDVFPELFINQRRHWLPALLLRRTPFEIERRNFLHNNAWILWVTNFIRAVMQLGHSNRITRQDWLRSTGRLN